MDNLLVKDLKKDQEFFECEYGVNEHYTALEDARRVVNESSDGWECKGRNDVGEVVNFFQDHAITHYGPHLYKTKQYVEQSMIDAWRKK